MHVNYWREIKKSRFALAGLGAVAAIGVLAVLAPFLTPYGPFDYAGAPFSPPSAQHLLGTDDVGQDILTRLIYGGRTSLGVGVAVGIFTVALSAVWGSAAALTGGLADGVLMRVADAFLVLPPVFMAVLVAAYIKPSWFLLVAVLSLFMWPGGARLVRSRVLSLKASAHLDAARSFGAGLFYLVRRHIVPDLFPTLAVIFIQDARRAVFMEAGLSFLGVSCLETVSWGRMLQQAVKYIYLDVWKWWLLPVGLALTLTLLGFTAVGYILERAALPRLKGVD